MNTENNNTNSKTIEETLNEIKESINTMGMTKEQAEDMIKKCDILIKKNKKNIDKLSKLLENNECNEVNNEIKVENRIDKEEEDGFGIWEELIDTIVIRDQFESSSALCTIGEWFGEDEQVIDDNVYYFESRDFIVFADDESKDLSGIATMSGKFKYNCDKLKEILSNYYEFRTTYWYDRRTGLEIRIYEHYHTAWLIYEKKAGSCAYSKAISKIKDK